MMTASIRSHACSRQVSRALVGLAALSSIVFGSAASATDGVSAGQILIGQTISLQEGKNDCGVAVLSGIQTYLNVANNAGGVHGRKIVLKTLDDQANGERAAANAQTLIEKDKVFLLFGSIEGGPSTAVMKIAVDAQVPFFGPMAGAPTFRQPHQPLVFPVRAGHRREFRALLEYARKTGAKRAAFVRVDSAAGRDHLENFKIACKDLGLDLVDLPFKPDITDAQIEQMAARLGDSKVDVAINHGSIGMYEKLIRKARALGVRTAFSGVNSGSAQLAAHLGPLAHGMLFSQVVPSPWERKSEITREYQEEFSRQRPGEPFSYGSLEGYVTAKALVSALRQAGPNPTRESFARGVYAAHDLELAHGLKASYAPGEHAGLTLVDLAIVTREGRFLQ